MNKIRNAGKFYVILHLILNISNHVIFTLGMNVGVTKIGTSAKLYHEKFRPQLHYSVPTGWMNDPDGLMYYKGLYHLFYQNNPHDTKWGPMHWGHATSKDLIHWETLPTALYPQGKEYIFSGSAIVDYENVTGLQHNENKTMIAIFTAHIFPEHNESQWMAYSTDEGIHWNYYKNNPIITIEKNFDFRDPKVFKYSDYYVVLTVVFDRILIFKSHNLIQWTLMSEWGQMEGSHQGVWETPDLFPANVTINGTVTEKWVLLISTANTTGVSTGPNTQYFIGWFDGQKFTNENDNNTVLWLDYGPDNYAGVTYERTNSQHVFMSWMNRWDYAEGLQPVFDCIWNGQNAIPRDMKLVTNSEGRVLLSTLPVPEIEVLRTGQKESLKDIKLKANSQQKITKIKSKLLDIDLRVNISRADPKGVFGIEFSGVKDKLRVYYNGSYVIDRTDAGLRNFSHWFHGVWRAPRLTSGPQIDLRLILDVSSIEMFADSGLSVMTALFFTEDNITSNIRLFYESNDKKSELSIIQCNIHELKSIWK